MTRLTPPDRSAAPEKSRQLLDEITARTGEPGAMVATMAHSPALLQGYLELSRAIKRVKLPRALSEKISLAVQEWLGCALCLAAHTEAARAAGVSEADIALARQATSPDAREAALLTYAVRVLAEPASISDEDVADLRAHGWTDRTLADVVGLVSLNHLTGAFNLVAGLEPAAAEEPQEHIYYPQ
ncbi:MULTISPECIES: carboxymuconolactone decarboxylase family protein [Amycolatopsis]|uniref:Carboxymuconolactone decarboxylase family protein n=1 Tax=Amycolatopsis echigonensis TaxID=2576905 RepID=A0A2N3WL95_9PSEU|nr:MULTISPECIES: carboxymuconolactone decarboxylase family protein [Amycolatopsis]MBB2499914.1 carboxymuconolactone decarboxylase family protein [Amycolatopsis echigonensis]MCG3751168.1 carboxymuconolactone decarboxylase family protein [Amycolatopsis sp. Poz14]PKV94630.1 putative peroxidase-related enzyme [Amycolatopsis niigatensis]